MRGPQVVAGHGQLIYYIAAYLRRCLYGFTPFEGQLIIQDQISSITLFLASFYGHELCPQNRGFPF